MSRDSQGVGLGRITAAFPRVIGDSFKLQKYMTCSLCNGEIPEERLRKHSKFCSEYCRRSYRLLYMKFRKTLNALWQETLADNRKAQVEASNSVTEVV